MATVWDMLSNGDATAAEAVGCDHRRAVASRPSRPSSTRASTWPSTPPQLWAPESERAGLEARVAAACRGTWSTSGASRQAALRALVRTAASASDLDALLEQIGDDVDLQWYVLERRAELGTVDADAVQALERSRPRPRRVDPRPAGARELAVRGRRRRRRGPQWSSDRTVPIESARTVAAAFWRPGQEERAGAVRRALPRGAADPPRGRDDPRPGADAPSLFPLFAIDEAWVARAREVAGCAGRAGRRQRADRAIRRGAADGAQPRPVRLCPPR